MFPFKYLLLRLQDQDGTSGDKEIGDIVKLAFPDLNRRPMRMISGSSSRRRECMTMGHSEVLLDVYLVPEGKTNLSNYLMGQTVKCCRAGTEDPSLYSIAGVLRTASTPLPHWGCGI